MRIIVSDTSPIRYLVLIGEGDVVRMQYGRILIPTAVFNELQQPCTPEVVRECLANRPEWIEIIPGRRPIPPEISRSLDEGEREAIALALDCDADLLLMDDRSGVREARRMGLTVTGTLGILVRAAEAGLVDLKSALARLEKTNFRIDPRLLRQLSR